MAIYVYWFLFALILLGVEMATGMFYLLVVSIAFGVAGVAALLGFGMPAQFFIAGLISIVGTVILHRWKGVHDNRADSQHLDTGQPVRVITWREDGTARVFYRGAEWEAELDKAGSPREGTFHIKAMRGSVLILTNNKTV